MAENLFGKIDSRGSNPVTYNFTPLSTAEAFSISKAYAVGDYCFYSGDYYKCTTAKAAGAWSADNFEKVTVSEELKGIVNGYHPDMTAGDAEQLVSTQYAVNKTPYLYRTTGGSSDVGNREYVRGIVGGTVAWNQMLPDGTRTNTNNGVTYTRAESSPYVLNGTASGNAVFKLNITPYDAIIGHKYLMIGGKNADVYTQYTAVAVWGGSNPQDKGSGKIANAVANGTFDFVIIVKDGVTVTNMSVNPQLFDLTQMFGSTIADYIYSLEQANAGAGVSFFRKLFPNDYYAYNAGELKSVEGVSSHEMVGFNQWDEEWENGYYNRQTGAKAGSSDTTYFRSKNFIPCLPNTAYHFKTPAVHASSSMYFAVLWYDADKNYITNIADISSSPIRTAPSNAHYMAFYVEVGTAGATYNNDICINLSWSGTHNGEYKPYEKHTYALDSSLTLRGIPKLDASNGLYYDGDVYAPDGTVTRRYGIVDLGTLNYTKTPSGLFGTTVTGAKGAGSSTVVKAVSIYTPITSNEITGPGGSNPSPNMTLAMNENATLYINNLSYTDAAAFKSAMSGVYLVYELATPTTETADPYTEIQICDDWGTEEYVSTSIVPVGHTTDYPANLRDKLQHLPDLASADGNYIVSQSGTQMTLAPLPIVIPAPPTTDGTYTFRATVSNGVPTLSWVEE